MTPLDPALTEPLRNPQTVLTALDFAGVAVFAATGALAAAREKHDLVTFAFFGAITGVGGGTLRDLLIGAPVFWVHDPMLAIVCCLAAMLVWMTPVRWWSPRCIAGRRCRPSGNRGRRACRPACRGRRRRR